MERVMNLAMQLFNMARLFVLCAISIYIGSVFADDSDRMRASSSSVSSFRSITINNMCPFDVSLQSVGANAAAMACSPNKLSAQANCPNGFVCYKKNTNTSYCVAGTVRPKSPKPPITKQSEILLNASTCTSGTVVTDTKSLNWGQCSCTANNQCGGGQVCQTVAKGLQQCFWGFSLPNNGMLTQKTGTMTLPITPNNSGNSALVASGKFYAKLACGSNGQCLSDNTLGAPATLIEYTFQNNNDWYDVSYINGMNLPATMYPVMSTNLNYSASDPYRCMAAGGDSATIASIASFQSQHSIAGNNSLQPFACTNNYDKVFDNGLSGFNFVSAIPNATTCSKSTDCTGGLACGLTLATVTSNGTGTTCGNRLGYWTYTQFCSTNSSYSNSSLGIACNIPKNLAYARCVNQASVTDQGPGRSCFNGTTTLTGDTCCGYQSWPGNASVSSASNGSSVSSTSNGSSGSSSSYNAQPIGLGDAPVAGVDTTYWKTNILPAITPIKAGCALAYSYQYDDPYSTFTCATSSGINSASYNINLCASGAGGINPPTPTACQAVVPKVYQPNQFTLGVPSGISITINACNASGICNTPVNPTTTGGNIYTATSTGNGQYQITATKNSSSSSNNSSTATSSNSSGGALSKTLAIQQVCTFTIPTSGCILPVNPTQQCNAWSVAPDGAWQNRSIGIPSF